MQAHADDDNIRLHRHRLLNRRAAVGCHRHLIARRAQDLLADQVKRVEIVVYY